MEHKVQELLEKIYEEGVAKGQEVAATVVRDAEREARRILEEAHKEADDARKQARAEAEELKQNVASELRLAAGQSISVLRQKISQLITAKAVSEPARQSFSDKEFIQHIIEALIRNWQAGQSGQEGLSLLLPDKERDELGKYFSAKAREALDGGLLVNFDNKLENGFRIGPADGRYVISFTEKDFETFFMDYLRPKTKALLYGSE